MLQNSDQKQFVGQGLGCFGVKVVATWADWLWGLVGPTVCCATRFASRKVDHWRIEDSLWAFHGLVSSSFQYPFNFRGKNVSQPETRTCAQEVVGPAPKHHRKMWATQPKVEKKSVTICEDVMIPMKDAALSSWYPASWWDSLDEWYDCQRLETFECHLLSRWFSVTQLDLLTEPILAGGVGDDMRKFLEAAQEDAEGHEDRWDWSVKTHFCTKRSLAKRMNLTSQTSQRSHAYFLWPWTLEEEEQPEGDDLRAFLREAQVGQVPQGWSVGHPSDGSGFEYVTRNGICMNMIEYVHRFYV